MGIYGEGGLEAEQALLPDPRILLAVELQQRRRHRETRPRIISSPASPSRRASSPWSTSGAACRTSARASWAPSRARGSAGRSSMRTRSSAPQVNYPVSPIMDVSPHLHGGGRAGREGKPDLSRPGRTMLPDMNTSLVHRDADPPVGGGCLNPTSSSRRITDPPGRGFPKDSGRRGHRPAVFHCAGAPGQRARRRGRAPSTCTSKQGGLARSGWWTTAAAWTADDLALCWQPHATSKIETEDDLLTRVQPRVPGRGAFQHRRCAAGS